MKQLYEHIKYQTEVRQSLLAIKAALRERDGLKELRPLFLAEPSVLLTQLKGQDAKNRKHTALILGALGDETCRSALMEAYEAEEQLFVRSAYLAGLQGCDCSGYLSWLKSHRDRLEAEEKSCTPEMKKHVREELKALKHLILQYEKPKPHRFTGLDRPADVILLTHRDYKRVTAAEISTGSITALGAGLKIRQANLRELSGIRTYQELLFCLSCGESLTREHAAEELAEGGLLEFLEQMHEGGAPFYFRLECKGSLSLEERSVFTKKLAADLEELTGGRLLNSTSCYEAELRLIEKKDGSFYPLVKLFTFPDRRFAYRKNSVAASIRPSLAALLMKLAEGYMKENGQVLDPFCGVGTMLLERNFLVHADTMYGLDIFAQAVAGARENAQIARVPLHVIQRDFFDFTHGYLFDEIVTNLPSRGKTRTVHDMDILYRRFFEKACQVLKPEGRMILYSHDRGLLRRHMREKGELVLKEEWLIHEKEGSYLFVIEREHSERTPGGGR